MLEDIQSPLVFIPINKINTHPRQLLEDQAVRNHGVRPCWQPSPPGSLSRGSKPLGYKTEFYYRSERNISRQVMRYAD